MSNIITIGGTSLFTDDMIELNGKQIPKSLLDQAEKYTIWSWYDVTLALHEIGHQVTDLETERIKKALFIKKLKHLAKDI